MSERTTIGGTVYEAIGSSSSNLLLKCNGTARIQWGGKLIDLIKNGKIASGDSQELIFVVSDESEITSDGIYVLTTQESNQLWISKGGNKYDLTNTDLYISASKPQTLTADQKKQALDNIGLNYSSLQELQKAGIQNGIAYVLDTKTLYTIKDGIIEEFKATLNTVAVDNASVNGDVISGKVKLVLSILDDEYLILADQRITANYSIHVKDSAQIGSENADATQGYRLYMDGGTSYLDVDRINVRHGIDIELYTESTFEEFSALLGTQSLKPLEWYLITDYQNPWKLQESSEESYRPILVRALNEKSIYEKGYLFKDHRVIVNYDPFYQKTIVFTKEDGTQASYKTKGLITKMIDQFNNEANFDFLNYSNNDEKNPFCTLHDQYIIEEGDTTKYDKSIFPRNSYNNKLTVYDLKGLLLKEQVVNDVITYVFDNNNANTIDFQFDDSKENSMQFYNNVIECRGLTLKPECASFYNNNLFKSIKLEISNSFCNNTFESIYATNDSSIITYDDFSQIEDNTIFKAIPFSEKIENVKCQEFINCTFNKALTNCEFGKIYNCIFDGEISDSKIETIDASVNIQGNIEKSTIKEILNNVTIKGNIVNSYVDKISDNAQINSPTLSNCVFKNITGSVLLGTLENSQFGNVETSSLNSDISDSIFLNISNSTINAIFNSATFKNLSSCTFAEGTISKVVSFVDLGESFDSTNYNLLYNPDKQKEIYINKGIVQVICIPEVIFYRGMIIMHSGIEDIPEGWAPCDGGEYEWNGKKSKTPDLTNRFIKAVTSASEVKETDNEDINDKGEFQLKEEHLPKHSHPHVKHTHTFSGNGSGTFSDSFTALTDYSTESAITSVEGGTSGYSGDNTTKSTVTVSDTVSVTISGETSAVVSTEEEKTWENKPIKMIPNYYSLIFIMKL